jgi:hypothetical protein
MMRTVYTEKKRQVLRKIYGALSLTTVLFIFQACYGMPEDLGDDVLIRGIVISGKTDQPIPGIKVTIDNQPQYQITDNTGNFRIYTSLSSEYKIKFEDIDSTNGGSFLAKDTVLKIVDESTYLKISLDDK